VAVLACDASAADAPDRVFAVQTPRILILCGGAMPPCRPFLKVDWRNQRQLNNDVRMLSFPAGGVEAPTAAGHGPSHHHQRRVRQGSPISGGYAAPNRCRSS